MSKIFIGMILIFINFNIDIGTTRIGLIPSFVGYIFMLQGLAQLEGFSHRFTKIKPLAMIMLVFSIITCVLDLLGISLTAGPLFIMILGAVYMGFSLYISYNIVMGVKKIEATEDTDLKSESLFKAWSLLAVFSVLSSMILFIPLVGVFMIVIGFVFAINYLIKFYHMKNLFNDMLWHKSSPE